ncbi:kinesin-like protein KIF20A isoform X2 [Corticium candelabrum]|uniref:kinesin-like protein KIF20A isoform X2 n=1 Tax=Corticium candelabrum TaxID=121492 RepID=UPI002E2616A6|nr:kinesin-like protein KIF20A isoform X2 [Corticium candelabrum]
MDSEDVRKRLDFTSTDLEQSLDVYLRVKPPETAVDDMCVNITSSQTVEARAPSSSLAYRNNTRKRRPATYKFSFSRVFPPSSSQTDMFRATCQPVIAALISDMQSSLVFSFGVTNSGKTFTIEGTQQDAGVLPRSLDVLFNSVGPRLMVDTIFRPEKYNDISEMDEQQSLVERSVLNEVCSYSSLAVTGVSCKTPSADTTSVRLGEHSTSSSDGELSDLVNTLQHRSRDTTCLDLSDADSQFSVFVSYVEIYNECLYDLLDVIPKKQQERRALPLSEDKSGNIYVKYLRRINVMSADDALRAVALGRKNRHVVATLFNEHSSRRISFVDLAGSERTPKISVAKTRVKESGNINKSLLTLKNCITTIRYNNNHRSNQRIIPYRESKLTRLLQNFFLNKGSISMIVNVSSDPNMFDETLHVLRFSAVASQVRIAVPVNETVVSDDSSEDEDEEFDTLLEEIENLREENLMLKREIRHEKSALQWQELRLRDQFTAESIKKLTEMDICYQESIDSERIRMEEAEQRRLSLQGRMMMEAHESEIFVLTSEINGLKQKLSTQANVVNSQLMAKMADKDEELEEMTHQVNALVVENDELNGRLLTTLDELKEKKKELLELEQKMKVTICDLNTQLNDLEMTLELEKRKAHEATASLIYTIEQKEAETKELQSYIHKMKGDQLAGNNSVTADEQAQSHYESHSLIVHDVETSLHSEIDVTPKAAKKKKRGRKRKSDENTGRIGTLGKIQKLDQLGRHTVSSSKSGNAKQDAVGIHCAAAKKEISRNVSTNKQGAKRKLGDMLFDAVFSPLAEKGWVEEQ